MLTFRHQRIVTLLRDRGTLSTRELREMLGVTAMTVWRDLRSLEELGLARRIRGGVQAVSPSAGEPDFEAKTITAAAAKQRIAATAAREFVKEGDVVAMEGGTTVATLVEHLPMSRISVITNSLPVALKLRSIRPALPVRLIGGWISSVSGNATGPEAVRTVEKLEASVCFISATGLDGDVGPTDPNPLEIEVKRSLAAIAQRTVLLVDSRKFGARSAAVTLHPRRLHALVTDHTPPLPIQDLLQRNGVRWVIAE
jgi:DeoR family transcriptional regulator, fructose operon transcriptional repressor